ncbi:hypothetical protein [Homoserinibacter sp. YIM 151385]|uniref:hypothetical protein n=1 Tax=Homoserinibacter sp. YIM 151385 TaxID=2985506 RepID=UPI0022F03E44|nr:hypothetical protein [Homoserinibacter sp. YIM 151385]WBU38961.1 hypothetical protein OF852_05105 [Homoserinibacter sp. YIM 151385]
MAPEPASDSLAGILPGRWSVKATNFPMWLGGAHTDPVFEYSIVREEPLVLADTVHYTDHRRGPRTVVGTDRLRGSQFVWRGRGLLRLVSSRWSVAGSEGDAIAIRFERSALTPAGVDVLLREGAESPELRTWVAEDPSRLGLEFGEFASLTWLDHTPAH